MTFISMYQFLSAQTIRKRARGSPGVPGRTDSGHGWCYGNGIAGRGPDSRGFRWTRPRRLQRDLVATRPDVVLRLHQRYLEAGADIVETDSFGGTPLVLAEYDVEYQPRAQQRLPAESAREAAWLFSVPARPRFVRGSIGPTTQAISVTGGITFQELIEPIATRRWGSSRVGPIPSARDLPGHPNHQGRLLAVDKVLRQAATTARRGLGDDRDDRRHAGRPERRGLPVSVTHADSFELGLNCATGPES